MGDISLRRRVEPQLQVDVWEVILGDEFLMTSLFTTGEIALADLGLAALSADDFDILGHDDDLDVLGQHDDPGVLDPIDDLRALDVVVGGLGLGYTARAALADERVVSVRVVDVLDEVIDWHRRHLTPLGAELTGDDRCELVHGDFFAMVAQGDERLGRNLHAILLDIDHSPRHVLHPTHAGLYEPGGLRKLAALLRPGGVFALWSNEPPDAEFVVSLDVVFDTATAEIVTFWNFYQERDATSTIYIARKG